MFHIASELETERLRLRMLCEADLDAVAAMHADPEVARYLSQNGQPMTRHHAWRTMAAVLGHWQLRGYGAWAIEEKASGQLVGRGGLWRPEGWPDLEVGWTLARAAWGKGYATEMAKAAMTQARERLGARHIVSVILPDNARSIRVAERLGERFEGIFELDAMKLHVYGREL